MRRLISPAALAVVLGILAASCGGSPSKSSSRRGYADNGTFTMQLYKDVGSFDPYRSPNMLEFANLAYDSLVNRTPEGSFVSGLAEKWSVDAKTATFTLRPDVTCSDGTPLTASQVAAAITYVSDPKNASPQYGYNTPSVPLKVAADDASRTVRVILNKPFGFLLHTIGQLPIVCAQGMKSPKTLNSSSAGTGPFVLTSSVPGQSYTLTVRKGYKWGPNGASTSAPGTPATIVMRVIENETTAANLQLSGELNLTRIVGEERLRLDARQLNKAEYSQNGAWLWFNQLGNKPTADKRVRQALVAGLDMTELIKVLKASTGGSAGPATGLIGATPKACPGNTVAGQFPVHDDVAANALLDQAGWKKGADGIRSKNGRRLEIALHYYPAQAYFKPAAELLAQEWKSIGVQLSIKLDSIAQIGKVMFQTSDYDVLENPMGFRLPSEMVKYLSGVVVPKGTNLAGIHNTDYNALVGKAAATEPPASCAYWNQAEQALWKNIDLVPIANRTITYYLRNAEVKFLYSFAMIPTSIRLLN